ncbi:hypothetical protein TNCV_1019841 [Trichonephila clavipes]|nr:hypothetical protein TNCV_1019841 [Trichonephila clavipes]
MSLRRRRSHYQHLTEFQQSRKKMLRKEKFHFRDITGRFSRISTEHDCWQQWSWKALTRENRDLTTHVSPPIVKTTVFAAWLWSTSVYLQQKL